MPSVSVGVTLGRESGLDVGTLLSVADRALYRAKELGRNRVETEMQDGGGSERAVDRADHRQRTYGADAHSSGRALACRIVIFNPEKLSTIFLNPIFRDLFVKTFLVYDTLGKS